MHRHFRLAIVGVLLTGSVICAQDKDKGKKPAATPNYYPLEIGNVWTYKVTVGDKMITSVSEITKNETFDKLTLARLELRVAGELKAVEHLRQTEKGVFRHRNNEQELEPAILLLPYPVMPNAKWEGKIKVGDEVAAYLASSKEETVAVPAGKYKAIRVTISLEAKEQSVKTSYWFVKDIGFVKQTVEVQGLNIVTELERFEQAKSGPKKQKSEESSTK